ncbi:MAG: hypothetical protein UR43_C0010G0020 [candidate division TM6 bacterium GW2011_GWF2_33_332]|nr:MAG: hypothetical protein UR43_C0010G0020 [candidate division TM6 bacterium GW2011_GWF2_33_332]
MKRFTQIAIFLILCTNLSYSQRLVDFSPYSHYNNELCNPAFIGNEEGNKIGSFYYHFSNKYNKINKARIFSEFKTDSSKSCFGLKSSYDWKYNMENDWSIGLIYNYLIIDKQKHKLKAGIIYSFNSISLNNNDKPVFSNFGIGLNYSLGSFSTNISMANIMEIAHKKKESYPDYATFNDDYNYLSLSYNFEVNESVNFIPTITYFRTNSLINLFNLEYILFGLKFIRNHFFFMEAAIGYDTYKNAQIYPLKIGFIIKKKIEITYSSDIKLMYDFFFYEYLNIVHFLYKFN